MEKPPDIKEPVCYIKDKIVHLKEMIELIKLDLVKVHQ